MASAGRILVGVEAERVKIKSAARRIIQRLLSEPMVSDRNVRRDWLAPPPISAFRRLEPLGFGITDEDNWVFAPEICTPDVVWPLRVGVVTDIGGDYGNSLLMSTFRTVTTKEVRGYAIRFSPYMVRMDHAQRMPEGMTSGSGLFVWIGGRWADAQKRTLMVGRYADHAEISQRDGNMPKNEKWLPALGTAIALRQRYEWAVSLGFEGSPTVRLATDPTGIKDIFRIRDLPEGKDRRDALLTWVVDHWRGDRHDPDIELYVRRHLRGAVRFNWWGMECEILPAQFDVEQRDKLIAEREAMRLIGEDRRSKN